MRCRLASKESAQESSFGEKNPAAENEQPENACLFQLRTNLEGVRHLFAEDAVVGVRWFK